jgi:hypothetical protein
LEEKPFPPDRGKWFSGNAKSRDYSLKGFGTYGKKGKQPERRS